MGHWNYRVMKKTDPEGIVEYGIYEVHYDDHGAVTGWTESPVTPPCSSKEELFADFDQMQAAFAREVLEYQ